MAQFLAFDLGSHFASRRPHREKSSQSKGVHSPRFALAGRRVVGPWARGGCPCANAATPIKRVGGPKLKTSLNAYSFNKALNDQLKGRGKGISLFDLIDFCAEQNFDAIDPDGLFLPGLPQGAEPTSISMISSAGPSSSGVDISGTGVRNNFAAPDKAKRAADVQHVKEWVEVRRADGRAGAPRLRRARARRATPGTRWPPGWPTT